MRLRASRALVALCAIVASACARPAAPPDYLVVGIESAPTALDPRAAVDASAAQITGLVFRGLVRVDPDGEPEPDLAESWEASGPLVWRFRLGRARFADGRPVRAADVVATYRSLGDPPFRGLRGQEIEPIAQIEAEDDATVRFTLRRPYAPFVSSATLGIVPASCAAEPQCLIGSGPFRVVAHDVDTVTLARVPEAAPEDDGAAPRGHRPAAVPAADEDRIRGIVFRASPDGTSRALGLVRGSIDLVQNAVEPELVPWLRARGLAVAALPGTTFQYLGLNLRVPALADARVRRAIAMAIDTRAIVDHVLAGYARPAGELLPPGHWAHAGSPPPAYDPAGARALLADAGAIGLRLSYKTSTVDLRRRIAEAMAGFLSAVGIDVELRPLEWAALYGDVRHGNFELFSLAWVGVVDPDLYFGWLHSSMQPPRGNNRGGYASPLVDRLTEDGRTELRPERRSEIYRAVAEQVRLDVPYVPLWWLDNVAIHTPRLCGFTPSATGDLASLADARWCPAPPERGGG